MVNDHLERRSPDGRASVSQPKAYRCPVAGLQACAARSPNVRMHVLALPSRIHMQPSQAAIPKPLLAHPAHKPQQVLKVVSQKLGLETNLTTEHPPYLFLIHSKIKQLCKLFFFFFFTFRREGKEKNVFPMGSVISTEKEALSSKKRCCQVKPCLPQPGRPGASQVVLPQSGETVEEIR